MIMFLISIALGNIINNNLISICVQIIVSGISYFGVLIILKDDLIQEGIDIVKKKLKIEK